MNKKGESALIVIIVLFVLLAVTFEHFQNIGKEMVKKEAVKIGHAKYVSDSEGSVKFQWLATQTKMIEKLK